MTHGAKFVLAVSTGFFVGVGALMVLASATPAVLLQLGITGNRIIVTVLCPPLGLNFVGASIAYSAPLMNGALYGLLYELFRMISRSTNASAARATN